MIEIISDHKDLIQRLTALESEGLFVVIDKKVSINFSELKVALTANSKMYLEVDADEDLKSFKSFETIAESILAKGITRSSLILAIGGGTVSDVTGFAASVLLRGIPWICVPTTLLAMVDAGIGGKTGIDTEYGKNLIGSFHSPLKVFICKELLNSLKEEDKKSGYGEMIKYGMLSAEIAQAITEKKKLDMQIELCAQYKLKITQEDFYDKGNRKFLNLGHTLGHAFEKAYCLPHGVAVFWGIYWEHRLFGYHQSAMKVLDLANMLDVVFKPKIFSLNSGDLWKYIEVDKKMTSSTEIELPLVNDAGQSILIKTKLDDLKLRIDNSRGTLLA